MSLVILLFGAIALDRLPNRELPDVDPPVVSVTTILPGAAPEVVETSVTQVLEDEIIGIEGIKHVTSLSRELVSFISVEFELYRDVDLAANDVRDRVARARRLLPDDVEEPMVAPRRRRRHLGRRAPLLHAALDRRVAAHRAQPHRGRRGRGPAA
jgi:multidrug efflux pump subunit AcrB